MRHVHLQSDFLVSYYYHAAKDAANTAKSQKLPDSLQNIIIAVVMSQCALEGYINYLIHLHKLSAHKVTLNPKGSAKEVHKPFEKLSIRDKWAHLPMVLNKKSWMLNADPFKRFSELVEQRNDLVHFDALKFEYAYESPTDITSTDDLMEIITDGSWLAGSKLVKLAVSGMNGHLIVHDMIIGLHRLIGTDPPAFLNSEKILFSIKFKP